MHKIPNFGLLDQNGDTGASGAPGAETQIDSGVQAAFEGGDNGGGQETASAAETHGGGSAQASGQGAQAQTQVQAPAGVTMTNEQLASLAATMVRSMPQAQQRQEAPQQITPELQAQFDRDFGVVRVTPEMFAQVFGVAGTPEQCKALENMLHNVARMSNAMAQYQYRADIQQREQALNGRLQPALSYITQQQATAMENDFFTNAPDLKDFKEVAQEVIAAAVQRGEKFKDKNEAFNTIATRVRGFLTKARGGTPPPKSAGTQQRRTMTPTSMGGRTGSTNGSQSAVSGPQAVFGDMDS